MHIILLGFNTEKEDYLMNEQKYTNCHSKICL